MVHLGPGQLSSSFRTDVLLGKENYEDVSHPQGSDTQGKNSYRLSFLSEMYLHTCISMQVHHSNPRSGLHCVLYYWVSEFNVSSRVSSIVVEEVHIKKTSTPPSAFASSFLPHVCTTFEIPFSHSLSLLWMLYNFSALLRHHMCDDLGFLSHSFLGHSSRVSLIPQYRSFVSQSHIPVNDQEHCTSHGDSHELQVEERCSSAGYKVSKFSIIGGNPGVSGAVHPLEAPGENELLLPSSSHTGFPWLASIITLPHLSPCTVLVCLLSLW